MGFTSDACWFLLIKTLLIKNNKKREAALKNEAGGDEKHVFLFFYLALLLSLRCFSILMNFYFQITFNWKVIFVSTWTKKIKISRLSSFKN